MMRELQVLERVLLVLFALLFLGRYLGSALGLLPEAISAGILVYILLRMALHSSICISPKYVILGVIIFLHILIGIVINSVSPGTVLIGIRPYIKWIPLFLLPMAYQFPDANIRRQLIFILCFLLIQAPVTLYQRVIQFRGYGSGDVITGTLITGSSGILSVLLLSGMSIIMAFYARGKITTKKLLLFLIVLGLPASVNETKITFVLLPFVLLIPYFLAGRRIINLSRLVSVVALLMVMFGGYIGVYNYFYSVDKQLGAKNESILAKTLAYIYTEHQWAGDVLREEQSLGENFSLKEDPITFEEGGGRLDKMLLAVHALSGDPVKLWVGLGVGNATSSSIGQFSGAYAYRVGDISGNNIASIFIWEMGVVGFILFLVFLGFLAKDAFLLSRENDMRGTLAAGWVAVMISVFITLIYFNIFRFHVFIFLWAYISGNIATWRYLMVKQRYKVS